MVAHAYEIRVRPTKGGLGMTDGEDRTRQANALPVIAEDIEVSALREETGIVRVRKVVRQDEAAVEASDFCERVKTARVPIGRVVDKTEGMEYRGRTLVIPVYEERWVKQVVLWRRIERRRSLLRSSASRKRRCHRAGGSGRVAPRSAARTGVRRRNEHRRHVRGLAKGGV